MSKNYYDEINNQLGKERDAFAISPRSNQDEISNAIITLFGISGGRIPEHLQEALKTLSDKESRTAYNDQLSQKEPLKNLDNILEQTGEPEDLKDDNFTQNTIGDDIAAVRKRFERSMMQIGEESSRDNQAINELIDIKQKFYALRGGVADKYYISNKKVDITEIRIEIFTFERLLRYTDNPLFRSTLEAKKAEFQEKYDLLDTFLEARNSKKSKRPRTRDVHLFDALYEAGGKELLLNVIQEQRDGKRIDGHFLKILMGKRMILQVQMERENLYRPIPVADWLAIEAVIECNRMVSGGFSEIQAVFCPEEVARNKLAERVLQIVQNDGEEAAWKFVGKLSVLADLNEGKPHAELAMENLKYQFSGGLVSRLDTMMKEKFGASLGR